MPDAYAPFLAVRYLRSRWVNALGVLGIAVAVWALIVVIAVFSGFIGEIRENLRNASPELLLAGLDPLDPERGDFDRVRAALADDPDITALAPRLRHYAVLYPSGGREYVRHAKATGTQPLTVNFVEVLGIDPILEARASRFGAWLRATPRSRHAEGLGGQLRVEDPERPFFVAADVQRRAIRLAGTRPIGDTVSAFPGLLIGFPRITPGQTIRRGELVDLITTTPEPDSERVVVGRQRCVAVGGFGTGDPLVDQSTAMVPIDTLRTLLGVVDPPDPFDFDAVESQPISEVAIALRAGADAAAVRARLAPILEQEFGGTLLDWEQQNVEFLGAVNQERALMRIVLFAVMLIAGFLIYATLHMMVVQKTKDIGILTSMGATPGGIAAIFLTCGTTIGVLGCALGTSIGILTAIYINPLNDWSRERFGVELFPSQLYFLEAVPYRLDPPWIALVVGSAFALTVLVAFLPARRAARMEPVQALSYE